MRSNGSNSKRIFPTLVVAAAGGCLAAATAFAAPPDKLKIGYISTMSGPAGSIGEDMLAAYRMGIEKIGGKIGGLETELVIGDDQARPQTAVQLARQMIERDKVHLFSGLLFSHVVDAVSGVVLPQGKFIVATSGGSSDSAGAKCHENLFIVNWNTDTMYEALGAQLAKDRVEKVAFVANNYQAGWDAAAGFKKGFGKALAAEVLTPLDQMDFAAELTRIRASGATAVVFFLPGGPGIAFVRQLSQSGLSKTMGVYTASFQVDETTFKALGDTARGIINAGPWNPYVDNPANKEFVAAYKAKFGRNPSVLAAMAYDTVLYLDAAIKQAKGEVDDAAALRAALRKAQFSSIRGRVTFGNNHFPIQNFYLSRVTDAPAGGLHNELVGTVFEAKADAHQAKCAMK